MLGLSQSTRGLQLEWGRAVSELVLLPISDLFWRTAEFVLFPLRSVSSILDRGIGSTDLHNILEASQPRGSRRHNKSLFTISLRRYDALLTS
jgi:hypothetical protein